MELFKGLVRYAPYNNLTESQMFCGNTKLNGSEFYTVSLDPRLIHVVYLLLFNNTPPPPTADQSQLEVHVARLFQKRYCSNNFNDIFHAFVVLFELLVVNQWHGNFDEAWSRRLIISGFFSSHSRLCFGDKQSRSLVLYFVPHCLRFAVVKVGAKS